MHTAQLRLARQPGNKPHAFASSAEGCIRPRTSALPCAPHKLFLLCKPLPVILSTPSILPHNTLSLLVILHEASREPTTTRWPPPTTPRRRRQPHLHCCWQRRRQLTFTWHRLDRHAHRQGPCMDLWLAPRAERVASKKRSVQFDIITFYLMFPS